MGARTLVSHMKYLRSGDFNLLRRLFNDSSMNGEDEAVGSEVITQLHLASFNPVYRGLVSTVSSCREGAYRYQPSLAFPSTTCLLFRFKINLGSKLTEAFHRERNHAP